MQRNEIFTISSFAKFSRTTRDTLIYYDKIGLLRPVKRKENGYRYYSVDQLAIINLIRTLQQLGMSLDDIKRVSEHRTPELMYNLLGSQIEKIDERLDELLRARKLLAHLRSIINSAIDIDRDKISIRELPEESLIMGDLNDYQNGGNAYAELQNFYQTIIKKYPDTDMNYPVWGHFDAERIKNGDWNTPDHYYFSNPVGTDKRPAGLYAVGYGRGDYGNHGDLYTRMINFIEENGYEICGPAWEEYPLNEISLPNPGDYLVRSIINVKKKSL